MNEYIGHPAQIRGAEQYTLNNGAGDGMKFLYIRNGLGLEAWISLDRAGDISRVNFKGDNFGYFAPCGYVAPQYYNKNDFLASFTAGFFTTCGLTAVGSPCIDDGENLPLHGTISNTPSTLNSVIETDSELAVTLTVRDAALFARKLILERKYIFSYTENSFLLEDTVKNVGEIQSPYMIMYHCNMGYPLLSENAEVVIPNNKVTPRDEEAAKYIDTALNMEKPQHPFKERCYYYDVKAKDNIATVGIFNEDINKGLVMSYDKTNLPCFTEWKMMGKSDYVLGLEPGNCYPDGRDVMRKKGILQFIEPSEAKMTSVKFAFTNDKKLFDSTLK